MKPTKCPGCNKTAGVKCNDCTGCRGDKICRRNVVVEDWSEGQWICTGCGFIFNERGVAP